MDKYTKLMFTYKEISGKKVQAASDGGQVSSDGGLLLLREIELRLGLIARIANAIRDHRHPGYVSHSVQDLKQRVFQIVSDYIDGNDCDSMRHDPVMKMVCEKEPDDNNELASQPTMCRFENAPSRTDLCRIAQVIFNVFLDSYDKPPKAIVLDIDDTCDQVHGLQQLNLFNKYHDSHCDMPIHIYEGQSGKLITAILRPGKRPTGKETAMILKRLITKIKARWPNAKILVRGDSHYASPEAMDLCEEHNINYIFGLASNNKTMTRASGVVEQARALYMRSGEASRIYQKFRYQAGTWSQPRRVIVKAERVKLVLILALLSPILTTPGASLCMKKYIAPEDGWNCLSGSIKIIYHRTAFVLGFFREPVSAIPA